MKNGEIDVVSAVDVYIYPSDVEDLVYDAVENEVVSEICFDEDCLPEQVDVDIVRYRVFPLEAKLVKNRRGWKIVLTVKVIARAR